MSIEMQVETFDCVEVMGDKSHPEVEKEVLNLIDSLELDGQKVNGKLNPFPQMTREQVFVYNKLCPEIYDIKEYNRTQIPLRVLQTYDMARKIDIFSEIEIWDVQDTTIKDPVMVALIKNQLNFEGIIRNGRITSMRPLYRRFLLARWGESLEPFEVLKTKAFDMAYLELKTHLKRLRSHVDHVIDTEFMPDDVMNSGGFQKGMPELIFE